MHTQPSLDSLRDKDFRDAYVDEHVRTFVAYQLRSIRKERKLTQKQLAGILGKPASVVSRLENVEYGRVTIQTLLNIAHRLDVALVVKFAEFSEFLSAYSELSHTDLATRPYSAGSHQGVPAEGRTSSVPDKIVIIPSKIPAGISGFAKVHPPMDSMKFAITQVAV